MTYEEYDKSIKEIISKPDTAMVDIGPILETLKTDLEGLESLKESSKKLEERVRDLQDTNAKLFLGATGGSSEEDPEPEELEGAEALNAFVTNLVKGE